MTSPPTRLVAAVEALNVRPGDEILEIGPGAGVAAAMICERLGDGRLVAIDRSPKAIASTRRRNAEAVAAGKLHLTQVALEDADRQKLGQFDKVLAVNINLFWVRPPERELRLIAELLRPHGTLVLAYDPPGAEQLRRIEALLAQHFEAAGYEYSSHPPTDGSGVLLTEARPGAAGA